MLNVLIYDGDASYINRLMQQLTQSKSSFYTFTACSSKEAAFQILQSSESFQVYVASEDDEELLDQLGAIEFKIKWVERLGANSSNEILKYQSYKGFIDALDGIVGIGAEAVQNAENSAHKISLVLSPEGGSGKTACALALSKLLSKDFRTLFLSFETQSDVVQRLSIKDAPSMADLFYFVKRTDEGRLKGFQKLFGVDEYLGFAAIAPFKTQQDMNVINTEDLCEMMNMIRSQCDFEHIVIDSNGKLDPFNLALLREATDLWLVSGSSVHSQWRQDQFQADISAHLSRQDIKFIHKIHRVRNETLQSTSSDGSRSGQVQLPFDPLLHDSYRSQVYSLLSRPFYKALKKSMEGRVDV